MKDLISDDFQKVVSECIVRHRSILDILSKHQEASARVSRAVAKAATSCGCISIRAEKPEIPEHVSLQELPNYMSNHIDGELCEDCRETIETEIGTEFFYLTALCDAFNLNLYDIFMKEHKRLNTLGIFNLS
ncbi:MAG: DUF1573 domain-containing protein [Clostridia bacterium]